VTAIPDTWLNGEWTDEQRAVLTVAEVLADQADKQRPWWRRRKNTPMDFIPVARMSVTALLVAGWQPPEYGRKDTP
jgi:hypothetical protein